MLTETLGWSILTTVAFGQSRLMYWRFEMQMTLVKVSITQSTVSLWCWLQRVLFPWLVWMHILPALVLKVCMCCPKKNKSWLNYFCVTLAKEHYILLFHVFWHVMLSLFTNNPPLDNRQNNKLILCIKKTTALNTFITGAVTKCILQSQEKASV